MRKLFAYVANRRKLLFLYMLAIWFVFAWGLLIWEIPNEIYVAEGDKLSIEESIPVTFEQEDTEEVFANRWKDHFQVSCNLFGFIPVKSVTVNMVERKELIPVGQTVGILLHTDGVYVVDTDVIRSVNGENISPCGHSIKAGDYITEINGKAVTCKEDVMQVVKNSNGEEIHVVVRREEKLLTCDVEPVKSIDQDYKLGIWIKDDIAGIGTITYIDSNGDYGALGHGISSSETDQLLEVEEGSLYESEIASINKGEKGTPGSLVGLLYFQKEHYLGTLDKNTNVGIFGHTNDNIEKLIEENYMPVGFKQEIKTGPAEIYASIDGEIRHYDIEIEDIVMNSPHENKSMLIRVTDEELLKKTGGIVQGVSGSPILQNGKLVGAVTHVLVNDPTRGYGIFIENMLDAAG